MQDAIRAAPFRLVRQGLASEGGERGLLATDSPTTTAATPVTASAPVVVHRSAPRPSQPSFNPGGALPGKPTVRALRKQRAKHKR